MELRTLFAALFVSTAAGQSFDVASIKPTPPSKQRNLQFPTCTADGRFSVAGAPVLWSLRYAFGVKDNEISGAPSWVTGFDATYDIDARPPAPVNTEQCRRMLQALFVERFKLSTHKELKETPVYLLVPGSNGSKLREGGPVRINGAVEFENDRTPRYPKGLTMPQLATILANFAGRAVIDRTGLAGTFGIDLKFARKVDDDGPSIFTGVQNSHSRS